MDTKTRKPMDSNIIPSWLKFGMINNSLIKERIIQKMWTGTEYMTRGKQGVGLKKGSPGLLAAALSHFFFISNLINLLNKNDLLKKRSKASIDP